MSKKNFGEKECSFLIDKVHWAFDQLSSIKFLIKAVLQNSDKIIQNGET